MNRANLIYIFLSLTITSLAIVTLSESLTIQVLVFLFYSLTLAGLSQKTILHPWSWFIPFHVAYSTPYPLYLLSVSATDASSQNIIPLSMIGLSAFLLPTLFTKETSTTEIKKIKSVPNKTLSLIIITLSIIVTLILLSLLSLDFSTKREYLEATKDNFAIYFLSLFLPLTMAVILRWTRISQAGSKFYFQPREFFISLPFFMAFLLIGERDIFFRLLLASFFIYFTFFRRYHPWYLFAIIFIFIFILPITQEAKAILVSNRNIEADITLSNILLGEFSSSSRNLHVLLLADPPKMSGTTFIWDIKRVFPFIFEESFSTGFWYNNFFRESQGISGTSGWGFSLVGEGFLNFGSAGVFALFFVVGLITKIIYEKMTKSDIGIALFIMYISAVVYSQRADLSNLINLGLKIPLLSALFLIIISQALNKFKSQAHNQQIQKRPKTTTNI